MHKTFLQFIVLSTITLWFDPCISSLPAGTMIATSKGLVCVESLKVDDKVLSYETETLKSENAIIEVAVTKVDKHLTESTFSIYTGKHRWIDASPKQLFFTMEHTSKTVNFVEAQHLTADHELVASDMQCIPIVKIKKAELCTTKTTKHSAEKAVIKVYVYAIEVEEPHTLLVAENFYDEDTSAKPRLLLTHNGIPALGVGVSFAFGSTPASISLAEASATLGGLGVTFGPAGLAIGLATSLGILGYQLFKSKNNKQTGEYKDKNKKTKDEGIRIIVDSNGNAVPLKPGQTIEGSPDGTMWQVKDANGKPTGERYDGRGHPKQNDPKAQCPHAHRVDKNGRPILDETGNPHLPVNMSTK